MNSTIATAWLLASVLSCTASARADELRLRDGRVLYGTVTEDKVAMTLSIATRDGVVLIARADVVERTSDVDLKKRLHELARSAGDTPFAHLQLAMRARDYGLTTEQWQHLDQVIAAASDSPALQSRLADFLGQLEPELLARKWRTASTEVRVRELLQKHRRDADAGIRAALLELLRREPNADADLRQQARRNGDPQRRLLAVEALVARGTAGNDTFAFRTTILDRDDDVRAAAAAISVRRGLQGAVQYLAPGLMHSSAEIRVRTAEAFANLGDPAAIKLLVLAGPNAGKALAAADTSVRAHVAFLQQQAYVRDFDVEVASASFIADPKIGVLQSGTVLDVTVHGVTEEQVRIVRVFRTALQHLAGTDPGPDPRSWATWLLRSESPATPPTTPTSAPPAPRKN